LKLKNHLYETGGLSWSLPKLRSDKHWLAFGPLLESPPQFSSDAAHLAREPFLKSLSGAEIFRSFGIAAMLEEKQLIYEFDNFRLDARNRELVRDGRPVALPAKAFDMLVLLLENRGRLVEKEEIFSRVWPDQAVEESNLTVQVSAIRKALGDRKENPKYIATVAGHGYRFTAKLISRDEEEETIERHSLTHVAVESDRFSDAMERLAEQRTTPVRRTMSRRVLMIAVFAIVAISLTIFVVWLKRTRPSTTIASGATIKSIAVLPFKPLVAASRDESLELGMADTLITRLGAIRTVLVRPTSSVRKYNSLEQDPLVAGRELNADAVLDGSIQRANDKIRMSVRLLRVADGATLWADQFDGQNVDILSVQDSISKKVVAALALKLAEDENRQLNKRYTDNTQAFEAYLKGRHYWNRETKESWEKGIEYFREAIRLDPKYALAYAGIADSYNMMGYWGIVPPKEAFPRAKEAATRSLEIDPTLAEAHCSLAYAKFEYDWNVVDVESEYLRAISLNPSYASAHQWYAEYLMINQRFGEAEVELKKARELDPLSQPINMITASLFYMTRRYDQAIQHVEKTIELDPNFGVGYSFLAACYEKKGMYDEAVKAYEREYALMGDDVRRVAEMRAAYQSSGMKAYWRKHIDLLIARSKRTYLSPLWVAMDYANLEDNDRAFEWLEKAYAEHSGWLLELKIDPTWDRLRDDARFEALLRRIQNPVPPT
jgi:DNA-binding winged helix-turn-helix (wHTH) protein/TolB-like protein